MGAQQEPVIPPHNWQAEEAILGALLIEGLPAVKRTMERLAANDFFPESHRVIFAAMVAMALRDEPVDCITTQETLKRWGNLDVAGGPQMLALLIERGSIAAYLDRYVDIVVVYALWRAAIQAGTRLVTSCTEGKENIADTLDSAIRSLQGLRERVTSPQP